MDVMAAKKTLTLEDLESQTALELPERETPALVVIGCVALCVGEIRIVVQDIQAAVQICAAVEALNVGALAQLTCQVRQNQ